MNCQHNVLVKEVKPNQEIRYSCMKGDNVKNWKTTVAGLAAAIAHVSVNGVSWKNLLVAAAVAAIGALAKDHNS